MSLDPGTTRILIIAGLALVLAVATTLHRHTRNAWRPRRRSLDPADLPAPLTEPLTLVSFAGRLCSDCQEVPHVAVAGVPELPLVQVSVTDRPDLVRRYGIREVPSLVLVDRQGRIRYARQGLPRAEELWRAMRPIWDQAWAEAHPTIAGRRTTHPIAATPLEHAPSRFTDPSPEDA